VFSAYLRLSDLDDPTPSITQRRVTIRRGIDEVRKLRAKINVNTALNTRNSPNTAAMYDLAINSLVLMYRKRKGNDRAT